MLGKWPPATLAPNPCKLASLACPAERSSSSDCSNKDPEMRLLFSHHLTILEPITIAKRIGCSDWSGLGHMSLEVRGQGQPLLDGVDPKGAGVVPQENWGTFSRRRDKRTNKTDTHSAWRSHLFGAIMDKNSFSPI